MRKNLQERREILKRLARDRHRHMLVVQHDAVLIVIGVRRILQKPRTPRKLERDEAMRLACGMIYAPRIALVLPAEQTFRIGGRPREFCLCDVARILLRLREIDRHIESAVLRFCPPCNVLVDARLADVVRGDAQVIIVIRRLTRRCRIKGAKLTHDLGRTRHHAVHDARIKEIALIRRALDQPLPRRIVEHALQDGRRRLQCFIHLLRNIFFHTEHVEQTIRGIDFILRRNQPLLTGKVQEAADFMLNVTHDTPSRPSPHTRADGSHATSTPSR